MKKALLLTILSLLGGIVLLYGFGVFAITIGHHNTHRLSEKENQLINNAVALYRERIESGRWDELKETLARGRESERAETLILGDIKNNRAKLGSAIKSDLVRCAKPQFEKSDSSTIYHLDYLTVFETGPMHESFTWRIGEDDEVDLVNAGLSDMYLKEWLVNERAENERLAGNFSHAYSIPFRDRFLEIRY